MGHPRIRSDDKGARAHTGERVLARWPDWTDWSTSSESSAVRSTGLAFAFALAFTARLRGAATLGAGARGWAFACGIGSVPPWETLPIAAALTEAGRALPGPWATSR